MPELTEAQLYDLGNRNNGCMSEAKWANFVKQYLKDQKRTDKKIKLIQARLRRIERHLFGPL